MVMLYLNLKGLLTFLILYVYVQYVLNYFNIPKFWKCKPFDIIKIWLYAAKVSKFKECWIKTSWCYLNKIIYFFRVFLTISQKTEDMHLYKRPLIMIAKHMN